MIKDIISRIKYDPNFPKPDEILIGIEERDGSIRYLEMIEIEIRDGWIYRENLPLFPVHRIIEIRTKDGRIIWKRKPKYPVQSK